MPEAIHEVFNPTLRCRGSYGVSAVIFINFLAVLPAFAGMVTVNVAPDRDVHSVTIRDEIIMRVPIRPHPGPQIEWREKHGPRCIAAAAIAGAMLSGRGSVDFVLRDRTRLRAKLDSDCPALDFYDGFYVQPEDHRLCMRRDVISSRMGGSCRIDRFRLLVPRLKH
jgi:hypothetical protein